LRFVGIDLGTTNCGLAWCEPGLDPKVEVFPITQVVAPGELRAEPLLESCLYLAPPSESEGGLLELPWTENAVTVCGRYAAHRGRETTGRLVSSAKSWLCQPGDDRTSRILPLNAPGGLPGVSPLEASTHYLAHLRQAWNSENPDDPIDSQPVVLTVPASFDAVARELTQRAASLAGLRNVLLLEEPQAAFYAWIAAHPDWRERVSPGDLILIVDVGGGTTDLSLIAVVDRGGRLELDRVAVGEHLLLGGDNMDLALAHSIAAGLNAKGRKLDSGQMHALWQQCRLAKERLLSDPDASEESIAILGRGSSLIGGTVQAKLTRAEVEHLLVDGFFPVVSSNDMPARRRAALVEVGLPYEPDAAITRHLARFLRQQAASAEHGSVRRGSSGLACPTHVLFNGGVFRAGHLRARLMNVLNSWIVAEGFGPAQCLEGEDLMLAVARGAAYYGLARHNKGVRIRGGIPRTYYVGIETSMPAVPGMAAPMKALTVAPFGMDEGSREKVPSGEFGLIVGEPAEFRFFASASRKNDALGDLLDEVTGELEELAPIQVTLDSSGQQGQLTRVALETHITETGTLELWCAARDGRRWKLEFQVRQHSRK